MENLRKKILGIVTLYNPDKVQALYNIELYAPHLDLLIVWDNSCHCHKDWFQGHHYKYHWDGKNACIAPAVNFAWHYALEHDFDNILIMDEDSRWDDFRSYRNEIEKIEAEGGIHVFTPYVEGCDKFKIESDIHSRRLFINSGTVVPVEILTAVGGVDEDAFPLDALDHDISLSVIEKGYDTVCLTRHKLHHSLGYPQRMGLFRIFTPNYNRFRTYHMTRSHIICYRKHRALMTPTDRDYLYKEILQRKLLRIILAETDKVGKLKAFFKGIYQGLTYKV